MEHFFDNKFINIATKIFDAILYGENKEIEIKHKIAGCFYFLPIYRTEKKIYNEMKEDADKELSYFYKSEFDYKRKILNFNTLWQFCQFVRFAEKTFFYKNDIDKSMYIDSDMMDLSCRKFKITDKELQLDIYCSLEKVKDKISDNSINVIKLKIERKYGKEMTNTFTIVDGYVKTKDTSDMILIDNIMYIINKKMQDTFTTIINEIKCFR